MTVTASTLPEPQFKHYDRDLIRDDLEQRVTFARDFLRFTEDDGKLLNSVAPLISPLIKPTVDGVYTQLFRVRPSRVLRRCRGHDMRADLRVARPQFDVTSRPFLKKNADYEGNEHAVDLSQLNHDDPQISCVPLFLLVRPPSRVTCADPARLLRLAGTARRSSRSTSASSSRPTLRRTRRGPTLTRCVPLGLAACSVC